MACRHFFLVVTYGYDTETSDPISIFKIEKIRTVRSTVIIQHVFLQDLQPCWLLQQQGVSITCLSSFTICLTDSI